MPAYKNKDNGTWYVMTQYTNWKGKHLANKRKYYSAENSAVF